MSDAATTSTLDRWDERLAGLQHPMRRIDAKLDTSQRLTWGILLVALIQFTVG